MKSILIVMFIAINITLSISIVTLMRTVRIQKQMTHDYQIDFDDEAGYIIYSGNHIIGTFPVHDTLFKMDEIVAKDNE